jgi:hypothetical protein
MQKLIHRLKPTQPAVGAFLRQLAIVISLLLLTVATASAQIYKSVDAQGNVSYSDQPSPGAQPIQLEPLSITPEPVTTAPPTITPIQTAPITTDKPVVYQQLQIISPTNDQTIWNNNGQVTVSVSVMPALAGNDSIQLVVDGKITAESTSATNFNLDQLDRGTHVIQAQIVRNKKQIVKVSNSVTFYIHKAMMTTLCTDTLRKHCYILHTAEQRKEANICLTKKVREKDCLEKVVGEDDPHTIAHIAADKIIANQIQKALKQPSDQPTSDPDGTSAPAATS